MKLLKITSFSLLGILSVFFISNLFFNKNFKVSTSIEIDSSPFIVYDQINNFKNWSNWDPWIETDTTIIFHFSEISFDKGAYRTWKSNNSGDGKIEIINNEFLKRIDFLITLRDENSFKASFILESINDKVSLTWENKVELPYLARILGPIISKMMKNDHLKGLKNIKDYCESIAYKSSDVEIKQWTSQNIILVRDTCTISEINNSINNSYNQIFEFLAINNKVSNNEQPLVQYISFPSEPGDKNMVVLYAGILIDYFIEESLPNKMVFNQTKTEITAQATHNGDYRTIFKTHEKIKDFCKKNNYSIKDNPYEIYINNPNKTTNLEEWKTQVIYVVN